MKLRIFVLLAAAVVAQGACAAPRRVVAALPGASVSPAAVPARPEHAGRLRIGLALGGGSARGLAHVGLLRWLEEHHVPVDLIGGTSMGGLVGGGFATGMNPDELEELFTTLDWDTLFGESTFAYKNIRRRADARLFPSRIEFGLKGGLTPPTALNTGEQVDWLLARITAPYYDIASFDELPTPFRAVAVDLLSASQVILRRGSLARAMRATMSLPLIFPPVELDGQLLVDGGAMNNIPADVVRVMGADRVIAVNVGEIGNVEEVDTSMLGVAGATIDAMMRDATRRALDEADVVIHVQLDEYGSLDWRRGRQLIEEGYKAAEDNRDLLLQFAIDEAGWMSWVDARRARRRPAPPVPTFVEVDGLGEVDAGRLEADLSRHVGTPVDPDAIVEDLEPLSGLDRYDTVLWGLSRNDAGATGLVVSGEAKPYAPPFLMLGVNLQNTTSSDFQITATARYLAYDLLTSASELRIDGTIGSNPAARAEFYLPVGRSPLFVAPSLGVVTDSFNVINDDDALVARYDQTFLRAGAAVGVNLGVHSDLRAELFAGYTQARVGVGPELFPEIEGREIGADVTWRFDGQDSAVIPSHGTRASANLIHIFRYPDTVFLGDRLPAEDPPTQVSGRVTRFWQAGGQAGRVFVAGGLGATSGEPLPHHVFNMGAPLRLAAYRTGEIYGRHYFSASGGYLRQVARLPDFVGGPVFAGGWLENADAFDDWEDATWRVNLSGGVIMDTLLGPAMVGLSAGVDGRWRTFIGLGRIFE